MSILNLLKEKDINYNKKMKSSGQGEVIFPFHTSNTRELKTMFKYLDDIEEVIGISRKSWTSKQNEKHKQKNSYLESFNLIKKDEIGAYYYTKIGQVLKYLRNLYKDKNEEELLGYLALNSYKNIYNNLENFYNKVKLVYSKEEILKLTEEVIYDKKIYEQDKNKLLKTEIFYVLMFYKDIELLKEFKKNSIEEIEELSSKKCMGTFIEDKIKPSGSYTLTSILEDIIIINYLEFIRDKKELLEESIKFFQKYSSTFEEEFINDIKLYSNTFEYNLKINEIIDLNLLKHPQTTFQKIFYGAPGTGKSYSVSKLINEYYEYDEKVNPYVFRTTIYQDYSYYDFIGNIMPKSENGKIEYEFKPGPFTLALEKALVNPEYPIFLVIEEMSRGNIASIFGDIFQLLDRKNGVSDYSITNIEISKYIISNNNINDEILRSGKIYLPKNLHILGTVNTCDQNVNVMDTAFKRRFDFKYISVAPLIADSKQIDNFEFKLGNMEFEWNRFYMALNEFIKLELGLSEDKQIGQFFIKFGENKEENYESLKNKLLHYLWEDVVNVSFEEEITLFDEKIKTFDNLYYMFEKKENIFSEEFLKLYKNIRLDNSKLDESHI